MLCYCLNTARAKSAMRARRIARVVERRCAARDIMSAAFMLAMLLYIDLYAMFCRCQCRCDAAFRYAR